MTSRILSPLTIATMLALGGCSGSVTLSDLAKASCVAQDSANIAGRIATAQGSAVWAESFAHASRIAGIGCIW